MAPKKQLRRGWERKERSMRGLSSSVNGREEDAEAGHEEKGVQ